MWRTPGPAARVRDVEILGEDLEVFEATVLQLGPLAEQETRESHRSTEKDDQGSLVNVGLLVAEPEPGT